MSADTRALSIPEGLEGERPRRMPDVHPERADRWVRGRGWGRRRMRGPNVGKIDGRKDGGGHGRWEVDGE